MVTVEDSVATVITWYHRLSYEASTSLCWHQQTSRPQLTHFKEQDPLQMRTFRLTIHVHNMDHIQQATKHIHKASSW